MYLLLPSAFSLHFLNKFKYESLLFLKPKCWYISVCIWFLSAAEVCMDSSSAESSDCAHSCSLSLTPPTMGSGSTQGLSLDLEVIRSEDSTCRPSKLSWREMLQLESAASRAGKETGSWTHVGRCLQLISRRWTTIATLCWLYKKTCCAVLYACLLNLHRSYCKSFNQPLSVVCALGIRFQECLHLKPEVAKGQFYWLKICRLSD